MTYLSNMTSKGQVTVPKDIRDALGLKAGDRVGFELTPDGYARILPANREADRAAHIDRIRSAIAEARRTFRHQDNLKGLTNQEFYDLMRGPPAEV